MTFVESHMNKSNLARCERIIERGKQAFIEVGLALMEIRDTRGYQLAGYETFEAYCRERWGWSEPSATYYIGAAVVAGTLPQVKVLDYTQARELARLASPDENNRRKKVIDVDAVKEVAASLDFTRATVKEVARAVDIKLAERRNTSVNYVNQPAIHAAHGHIPLAGTSHVYTVKKLLWPEAVEDLLAGLLLGRSLHLCCGKSKLGTLRLDLHEPGVDVQADAANTGLDDKSFDSVLCDPPYNGEMQWNHDLLTELARLACRRIIFQHWFIPANPNGQYKKANYFTLSNVFVWQPRTYFGRAQLISVFDAV
jgi:hypothetical protein